MILLRTSEKEFLDHLLSQEKCLEDSKGMIEGDTVVITEGSFGWNKKKNILATSNYLNAY